jgi:hypothetical protein
MPAPCARYIPRAFNPDPSSTCFEHTMAGTSLLALIDDIATLLDDVSVMTKVAAKKTAGVLGDDPRSMPSRSAA